MPINLPKRASRKCLPTYVKENYKPHNHLNFYVVAILSAFIILFFFGTIWYTVKCVYRCTKNSTVVTRIVFWRNEMTDVRCPINVFSSLKYERLS